jgi:GNAT superfamily N-acetyltransferase
MEIIELNEKYVEKYLDIIKQLSIYSKISNDKLVKIKNRKIYIIIKDELVIGTGSIFLLKKYHCKNICQIEDLVIDKDYRRNGYGIKLLEFLINEGKKYNCYKIMLDCKDENLPFYKKLNFNITGNNISLYLTF